MMQPITLYQWSCTCTKATHPYQPQPHYKVMRAINTHKKRYSGPHNITVTKKEMMPDGD